MHNQTDPSAPSNQTDLSSLKAEVRLLTAELARTRAQLRKAYVDRADIHARLRSATRFPASSPDQSSTSQQHTPMAGKP